MIIERAKELFKKQLRAKDNKTIFCFEGDAGIGKSAIVKQGAAEEGYEVVELRLAEMEPGDLIGVPRGVDGKTVWLQPSWFPADDGKKYILFFDELNRAPLDVRQAVFQVLTEFKLHTHVLPKNVKIVVAINPANDNYQVEELGKAMGNRVCLIPTTVEPESFYIYAKDEGFDEKVLNFLVVQPDLLLKVSQNADQYPSPRSWHMLSNCFTTGLLEHGDQDEFAVAAGFIGKTAAAVYLRFVKDNYKKFLTAKEVFQGYGPTTKKRLIGQPNDAMSATIADIVSGLGTKDMKQTFKAKYVIVAKVILDLPNEYQVSLVTKLTPAQSAKLIEVNPTIAENIAKIINRAKEGNNQDK